MAKDDRFSRDIQPLVRWLPGLVRVPLTRQMLSQDPPDHTRLRKLVSQAFTPRRIERLRDRIQVVCDELLEAASRRKSFDLVRDYALPIKPFDASTSEFGTGGKDGKDARQQEAKTIQDEGPRLLADLFVSTLGKSGPFKSVRMLEVDEAVPDGALVVEGKFVTLDPGSRAKRYFAGFGAGKSSVKVAGTVKDSTGRTLASFEQRRIGAMGMGGGDSLAKLRSDSRSIGEDIAKFLAKWARGDNLE